MGIDVEVVRSESMGNTSEILENWTHQQNAELIQQQQQHWWSLGWRENLHLQEIQSCGDECPTQQGLAHLADDNQEILLRLDTVR